MMQLAQGFPLEILPLREMLTGIIEDFKLQVLFLCWSYRQEQTMALQQQMEVGLVHETMQLGVCRAAWRIFAKTPPSKSEISHLKQAASAFQFCTSCLLI